MCTSTRTRLPALHTLTGGWAAALRLAAISLRNAPDPTAFLTAFSGDERSVAEYLVGEILSSLSSDNCEFLTATSVCEIFPPDLAAELSGRQDAADLLRRLERETSVVAGWMPGDPSTAYSPSCGPTCGPTSSGASRPARPVCTRERPRGGGPATTRSRPSRT